MRNKEEIEYIKECQSELDRKISKLTKTVKILLEFLDERASDEDKTALGVLRKTLQYWGWLSMKIIATKFEIWSAWQIVEDDLTESELEIYSKKVIELTKKDLFKRIKEMEYDDFTEKTTITAKITIAKARPSSP